MNGWPSHRHRAGAPARPNSRLGHNSDGRAIVVAGETVVDLQRGPAGALVAHPGGSPANVAVALGRLGNPVRLLTAVGADDYGDLARSHLSASQVQVSATTVDRTSTALVRLTPDGAASYELDVLADLPELPADTASWLHVGSLAALLPPAADKILRLVRNASGHLPVSYDPNLRGEVPRADRDRVEELVSLSRVVKLSEEDAACVDPHHSPERLALSWLRNGPELVVITKAAIGAVGLTRDGARIQVPAAEGGPVVDTIGAGDAFMAGMIHAMSAEMELQTALTFAALVARRTCERAGADPPRIGELSTP